MQTAEAVLAQLDVLKYHAVSGRKHVLLVGSSSQFTGVIASHRWMELSYAGQAGLPTAIHLDQQDS